MKQESFLPKWKNDVTHQLRRDQIATRVSLNDTNFQQDVSGFFAILEPSFVASFCSYAGANQSPRICDLLPSQTLFAVLGPIDFQ